MLTRLHRLMDTARRTGWQASTGIQRSGEEAYVHARSGRPCRRCGDTVRVAMIGDGTAPAHDVLVPDLPGRAGPHRRRQAAAPAGQREAALLRWRR